MEKIEGVGLTERKEKGMCLQINKGRTVNKRTGLLLRNSYKTRVS